MVSPIAAKFGTVTHIYPFHPNGVIVANILIFNMAAAAMLRTQKSPYLGNALTNRHAIRQGDAKGLNRPCAAAMRPFIKLLCHFLLLPLLLLLRLVLLGRIAVLRT